MTDLTYKVPRAEPSPIGRVLHFALAVLIGLTVGLGLVAFYAYGTAEWWFTGKAAGYCALALVPLATALSALATAVWVGRMAAKGHVQNTYTVLVAGLMVFAVAAVVRVYPLEALNYQLPGYADTSPSVSRMFSELKGAELPLLGNALGSTLAVVYMLLEALVLFGALWLIARSAIHVPYCHACKQYCDRFEDTARFASAPVVQAVESMQARDWDFFRGLGPPVAQAPEWLRFDIASCISCHRTNTVSLQMVTQGGQRADLMVQDLKITQDDVRTVQRLSMIRSETYSA